MDYFALLNQPRRPWLETEELKARFLAMSAEAHPDRARTEDKEAATRRYAEMNAAYQCLREPKTRLGHLIELETGKPPQNMQENPAALMELFFALAPVFHGVDKFLKEKEKATSPLAKVKIFEEGMNWTDKLMDLQKQIQGWRENLDGELKALDEIWKEPWPVARVEAVHGQYSFLKRWAEQIQERISRLATD